MEQGVFDFAKTDTLAIAREKLLTDRRKGTFCPCCDQFVKIYKRQIHTTMAKSLIMLYGLFVRHGKYDHYYHFSSIVFGTHSLSGDYSKLEYWGLIEEKPKEESEAEKKTSGYWRITEKGKNFVMGNVTVPKYILLYDSKLLGFEGESRNIKQCLGKHFNYDELMNEFIGSEY